MSRLSPAPQICVFLANIIVRCINLFTHLPPGVVSAASAHHARSSLLLELKNSHVSQQFFKLNYETWFYDHVLVVIAHQLLFSCHASSGLRMRCLTTATIREEWGRSIRVTCLLVAGASKNPVSEALYELSYSFTNSLIDVFVTRWNVHCLGASCQERKEIIGTQVVSVETWLQWAAYDGDRWSCERGRN